jgi:hypothetical protein
LREQRETFDLIERYLQGGLSEEEHSLVDDKIMNDPSFAAEVRLSEQVNNVVAGANLDRLREKMTNDLAKLDRGNKTKWWTGGALALLITSGVAYVNLKGDNTSEITNLKNNNKEQTYKESVSTQQEVPVVSSQSKKYSPSSPDDQKEVQADTFKNTAISDLPIKQEAQQNTPVNENISKDPVQNKEDSKVHSMNCKISFHAIAHATCKGELKGKVDVDMESIAGGTSPYVFSMNHTESSSGIFSDLGEGKHTITIRDKSGCSASKEVMVTGKNCSEKKSFSINPDYGESWKIQFAEGESGHFSIYNKSGIVIFKGSFGSGESNEWNGMKTSGETAETGLYACILEYSTGKKETIQITVIR